MCPAFLVAGSNQFKGLQVAKIKLDLEPSESLTYEHAVNIPTPDGKGLKVSFTFKYRDRIAVAALSSTWSDRATARTELAGDTATSDETVRRMIDADVDAIMDVASGWNIDAPFDRDNLRKLCIKYAGAALAILNDYGVSVTQGRLGN
jgi:hypothetical protein